MAAIGASIKVRGYITQDKFLLGQSLAELEKRLGFHPGRLAWGASVVRLERLPLPNEFQLAAYSMTAEHRHQGPTGLDIRKLKELARAVWSLQGGDRLIKILPVTPHNPHMGPDEQYPPGSGVPQWKIVGAGVPGAVVARILPGMRYLPRY